MDFVTIVISHGYVIKLHHISVPSSHIKKGDCTITLCYFTIDFALNSTSSFFIFEYVVGLNIHNFPDLKSMYYKVEKSNKTVPPSSFVTVIITKYHTLLYIYFLHSVCLKGCIGIVRKV